MTHRLITYRAIIAVRLLSAFFLLSACSQIAFGAPVSLVQTSDLSGQQRDPRDWARDVSASEIADLVDHAVYFRYRSHVTDHHGDRIRDVIEAREATVARTILRDGHPLSDEESRAEHDRLNELLNSPSSLEKHRKSDDEGRKLAVDLIRLMPDAMIYTYTPGQPQTSAQLTQTATPARAGSHTPQIVLDYKPDPHWKPPTTVSEGLIGLEGRMWIDPATHQLLRIEGTVFRGVNLGYGMLAHIFPGGHLVLEQTDADEHRWMYARFVQEITVRAAMVKTINIHIDISASSFHALPHPVSVHEAVRMLLDTPAPDHP